MSIIITGLEMPTERESFNLTIKYNGVVLDTETGMQVAEAHELPSHGRLVDADAAIEDIRGEILEHQMNGMKGTPFYIEDLRTMWQRLEDKDLVPTILPAEEDTDIQKRFLQNWHEDGE